MNKGDQYELEIIEVMRRCLKKDSICIDIGAHKGVVLMEMQKIAPAARHYAFEPLPHLAHRLKCCFKEAKVFELALGDGSGESSFFFVKNAPAYSGLLKRTYDRPDPEIEEIRVEMGRMDDVIPDDLVVSFIKIDIEGGEYHAMLGGKKTISRSKPVIVFEAGNNSTAHYDVSPEMIYDLLAFTFSLSVSTMERWLTGQPPFSRSKFLESYEIDFYFIAYPDIFEIPSPHFSRD